MKKFLLLFFLIATVVNAQVVNPNGVTLSPATFTTANLTASATSCLVQNNNAVMRLHLPNNASSASFTTSGTYVGTVVFLASADNQITWPTAEGSQTAPGTTSVTLNGLTDLCIYVSAYTSGTMVVTINVSLNTGPAGPAGPPGPAGSAVNIDTNVISQNCTGYANCVTSPANTIELTDGTITNASPTISSVTYNFTSADVGKKVFGFQDCQASNVYNRLVQIEGTVLSVNGNSATLTANATAGTVSGACIIFGNPDDAAFVTLETNANASLVCPSVRLAGSGFMWTSWHFQTLNPTACANNESTAGQTIIGGGLDVHGFGRGATVIYIDPTISYTPCTLGASTKSCMVWPSNSDFHDFTFSGGGNSMVGSATVKVLLEFGRYSELERMGFLNLGFQDTALIGTYLNQVYSGYGGLPVYLDSVDFDGWGSRILENVSGKIIAKASSWQDGMGQAIMVRNGDQFFSLGGNHFFPMQHGLTGEAMILGDTASVTYLQPGDQCWQNGSTNSYDCLVLQFSAVAYIDGLNITNDLNINNLGIYLGQTSKAYVKNSILSTGGSSSVAVTLANSGVTFVDQGGNNYNNNSISLVNGAQYIPYGLMNASCSGTVTSLATLFMQWNVPNTAAQSCTAVAALNFIASHTGTLSALIVNAGTGGLNASSGVVTVMDNAVATAITCTLGTGTFCFDGTHYVTVTAGDSISIKYTTQATDTLANLKVVLSGY